jgi:phage terminase large subunit-like protein
MPSRTGARSSSSRSVEPPEVQDFADFCSELTLDNGRPFLLEPFERVMLADYFAGTRESLILIPKKNGKTTLIGALGIYHVVTTRDAECVIGAAAREQAGVMFRQIRGFIAKSPDLQTLVEATQRDVRSLHDEGRIRIMSSDANTGDGVIPTLALVDELHRHKNGDLYGVFADGLGPRDGRIVTITTAGDDVDSTLGRMRAKAYELPTLERDGAYRYARSGSGAFAMHEWALEPDQDREDMGVVKTANPASWHTLEKLRERRDSPMTTPWQWARFACGVWLQGEDTAIGPVEWGACGTDDAPPDGLEWRIGLDVGWKEDTTALVGHAIDDDGVVWLAMPTVLVPPAERGVALRKHAVLAAVRELADALGAREVVLDPENDGEVVAQDIEDDLDLEVVAHSQKPAPMAQAAERFYAAVREGKVRHPRDPVLTRQVLNAHRKATDDGRWRFVKENKQSRKHIDALIAAAMVHNVAVDALATADQTAWVFG